MVWCQQCRDAPHQLIDRLSQFYRFDHHIFLMDESTDLDHWLLKSSSSCEGELVHFTPRTVITVNDRSDNDGSLTEHAILKAINGKNTFLIVVVDSWTSQSYKQLFL